MDFLPLDWISKSSAALALEISELALLIGALLVVAGLIGEKIKTTRWQPWHGVFETLVIIGVAGEMLADGGVFLASARLQQISDAEVTAATTAARRANAHAAEATQLAGGAWSCGYSRKGSGRRE